MYTRVKRNPRERSGLSLCCRCCYEERTGTGWREALRKKRSAAGRKDKAKRSPYGKAVLYFGVWWLLEMVCDFWFWFWFWARDRLSVENTMYQGGRQEFFPSITAISNGLTSQLLNNNAFTLDGCVLRE